MARRSRILLRLRRHARTIFDAAVAASDPERAVLACLERTEDTLWVKDTPFDLRAYDRVVVVGAGKGSAAMARAVEKRLADRISSGLVIVKYGYAVPLTAITVHEAGHPIPDPAGLAGAQAVIRLLDGCTERDLVVALISGGGSALLPLPAEGVSLAEKQELTEKLLRCGATIHELNTVRKHISLTKGGGLAHAAYPATVINLMLSDVMGNNPDTIAAGPFVPDRSRFQDAAAVLEGYGLMGTMAPSIVAHIRRGIESENTMPASSGEVFKKVTNIIVADNRMACLAAKSKAEELGYAALVLACEIGGNTTDAAIVHAAIAKEVLASGNPVCAPACIISGGETTVVVKGGGKGGRNQEFALVSAREISRAPGHIVVLSGGTDGTDGPTDAAGGMVDSLSTGRGLDKGLDIGAYLAGNDSYHYLEATGDLLMTGPTRTNVMDLHIVLVEKA